MFQGKGCARIFFRHHHFLVIRAYFRESVGMSDTEQNGIVG